jgi:ubiquinone/menaquinone biosynthesis C-methylase UbiE
MIDRTPAHLQHVVSGDFASFAASSVERPLFNGLSEFLKYFRDNIKCNGPFAYQNKTLEMLNLQPGHAALEVGTGRGDDLVVFGKLVGETGSVTGIDHSPDFVKQTNDNLVLNGLSGDIRQGDVSKGLPFETGVFDRVYIERVLQYLHNPGDVIKECYRVLKADGRLVIFDSDWDTATIKHPDKELTRTIKHLVTDNLFASGQVGRELKSLAIEAGFTVLHEQLHAITHTPESAEYVLINPIKSLVERGFLEQNILERWLGDLAAIPQKQQSFSLSGMILCAHKPAGSGHGAEAS